MTYFFYCPNCGREEEVNSRPAKGCVPNLRDGYGMPIYHYECPQCHNLDAGYMGQRDGDETEKSYYKSVIANYQNIRGFAV